MGYTISYMEFDEDTMRFESWNRGLEEAKAHAKREVLVGTAKRASIRDGDGSVVFRYPDQ